MDRPIGELTVPSASEDPDQNAGATGFVTERLVATPLRASDAEELFPVLADPRLHRYTGGGPPASVDVLRDRYVMLESRMSPDGRERWWNWTLRTEATRDVIGYVQATVGPREIALAWVIGIPWQGDGFAKESVRALVSVLREQLPTQDVVASIHPDHMASAAVARSAGLAPTPEFDDGEVVWRLPSRRFA